MTHDDFMQGLLNKLNAAAPAGKVPVQDLSECYGRLSMYETAFKAILKLHGVTTCGEAACFETAQAMAQQTLNGEMIPGEIYFISPPQYLGELTARKEIEVKETTKVED